MYLIHVNLLSYLQTDVSEGVIRVTAPHLSKDSTKVQIDEDTTAKDIVVKFYHAQLGGSRRAQMLNGRYVEMPPPHYAPPSQN